jgi:hypothetical protein
MTYPNWHRSGIAGVIAIGRRSSPDQESWSCSSDESAIGGQTAESTSDRLSLDRSEFDRLLSFIDRPGQHCPEKAS